MEAIYQRPKKQRRQQPQNRVEKIEEEEPEVKCDQREEDNGDSDKVNCGVPTAATAKAPEGTAAAATARQQRPAPLAEQVHVCRENMRDRLRDARPGTRAWDSRNLVHIFFFISVE